MNRQSILSSIVLISAALAFGCGEEEEANSQAGARGQGRGGGGGNPPYLLRGKGHPSLFVGWWAD